MLAVVGTGLAQSCQVPAQSQLLGHRDTCAYVVICRDTFVTFPPVEAAL